MAIDLYVVHGSHPCVAVQRAAELKGVPFRLVELPPPLHAPIQRVRFGARTVPGMRLDDGEKVSGSMAIMRRLEQLAPDPPLFPPDGEARAKVERAEEWGDEVWQPIARRLLWGALRRRPDVLPTYGAGSTLGLPAPVVRAAARAIVRGEVLLNRPADGSVRADLRNLPGHLDRIDRWISEGVIGGSAPNAADLQIATTSRLMLTIADVASLFHGRPAERHARELFPDWDGAVPAGTYPADWLAGSPARQP